MEGALSDGLHPVAAPALSGPGTVLLASNTYTVAGIPEAAKHVAEPFRARHGSIPWRAMAGMRDRMIHDYLGVDYQIIWDVVKNKVPALRNDLERIVAFESPSAFPDT